MAVGFSELCQWPGDVPGALQLRSHFHLQTTLIGRSHDPSSHFRGEETGTHTPAFDLG